MVGAPELDAGLQGVSDESGVKGQNPLPRPAGHAALDAAQDTVGFLGCQRTLPAHVPIYLRFGSHHARRAGAMSGARSPAPQGWDEAAGCLLQEVSPQPLSGFRVSWAGHGGSSMSPLQTAAVGLFCVRDEQRVGKVAAGGRSRARGLALHSPSRAPLAQGASKVEDGTGEGFRALQNPPKLLVLVSTGLFSISLTLMLDK